MFDCFKQPTVSTASIFAPGEHFSLPPQLADCETNAARMSGVQPTSRPVRVSVPLRLYSYVHDLRGTRVRPMQTYAVAQAVEHSQATNVTVVLCDGAEVQSAQPLHGAIRHFYQLFCQLLGKPIGVRVSIDSLQERHVGLGSSSAELLAFLVGFNRAVGNPFTWQELRLLLCWNFVERDLKRPDLVVPAATAGCAFVAGMYGGLTVLGPSYELIAACPIPDNVRIVAYIPVLKLRNERTGPPPTPYYQPFPTQMSNAEAVHMKLRDKLFFCEAVPAIRNAQFDRYIKAMKELLRTRRHAFATRYGEDYLRHLYDLEQFGAILPGQSSSGPAVFFYAQVEDVQRLVDLLWKRGYVDSAPIVGPPSRGLTIVVGDVTESIDACMKEERINW